DRRAQDVHSTARPDADLHRLLAELLPGARQPARPASGLGPPSLDRQNGLTSEAATHRRATRAAHDEGQLPMKSALEIAADTQLQPIADIAAAAGIQPSELETLGLYRGKVKLSILDRLASKPNGKLVIVTAITPTKAGEGKTTTSVALTMGL